MPAPTILIASYEPFFTPDAKTLVLKSTAAHAQLPEKLRWFSAGLRRGQLVWTDATNGSEPAAGPDIIRHDDAFQNPSLKTALALVTPKITDIGDLMSVAYNKIVAETSPFYSDAAITTENGSVIHVHASTGIPSAPGAMRPKVSRAPKGMSARAKERVYVWL